MYRKRARKDYLRLSKSKKRSGSAIRSAVRKQLQYIHRDISYVAELVQKGAKLSPKQAERLNVVTTVYEQQRIMFESGTRSIPQRIVSLAQPWVRPIVRGKTHANTEFGPKMHISLVDGYARIERLDFEPFNRLLAKLSGTIKIADTSNQGKVESKALSAIAVPLRKDTKPFHETNSVFNKDTFA